MLRQIPNLITLINLFCGALGCIMVINNNAKSALILMGVSLLADILDGFAARQLGGGTELGKQLDSLADVISFGLLPGLMVYTLIYYHESLPPWVAYFALLIPVSASVRLAKFNIDDRQTKLFIGLPTPAMAIVAGSVYWICENGLSYSNMVCNPIVLLGLILFLVLVMHAPVRLLSFKAINEAKAVIASLGIILVILFVFFKFAAVPIFALIFMITGWINQSTKWY